MLIVLLICKNCHIFARCLAQFQPFSEIFSPSIRVCFFSLVVCSPTLLYLFIYLRIYLIIYLFTYLFNYLFIYVFI